MRINLFVPGKPVPKQSFRVSSRGRHGYTDPRVTAWADYVNTSAIAYMIDNGVMLLDGDLAVDLTFVLPNRLRVDLDNLSKNVLDALTGVFWHDDAQIVDLRIQKYFDGVPSVRVQVDYAERG